MKFFKISKPNKHILSLCINLASEINKFDNINNPIFDIDEFISIKNYPVLYYAMKNNELIGFIGISMISETEIEICGFVHPKHRNLKVASHLLEMVFDDYEDFEIKIPLVSSNSLGKHFLESYNGKYQSTECIMVLKKDDYHFTCPTIKLSSSSNQQITIFSAFVDDIEVGTACVYNHENFIIHNVEIYEKYREKKYGQSLLHTLLLNQFKYCDKATLHVTKENTSAFNLYTKLGFTISKQLEYYSL